MENRGSIWSNRWFRMAVYFAVLLPVMIFRELTPTNELKYLAIADEALRNGYFWCPALHGVFYADKPPLYIWILMLCKQLFGCYPRVVLELFSVLPALGTLLIFDRWCERYGNLSGKWIPRAELGLLCTAYFLGAAMVVRMDMLMTLFITLAMYTFWKVYSGDATVKDRWLFPVYVFLAIFSKGPVGFLMPFVCILVWLIYRRKVGEFSKIWGWRTWTVLLLLCGIWWLSAYLEGGSTYLKELLGRQTFGRAVNAFHHKEPFYYYLYTIWYAAAPGIFVAAWAVIWAFLRRKTRKPMGELTVFFLVVFASFFVMMSLFSGKLQVYLLPGFGFVMYAAFMILKQRHEQNSKPESC